MKTMRNYLSQLTEYLFGVYGLGSKTIMYKFTCQKFCTAKATLKLEDELGVGGHAFNPSRGRPVSAWSAEFQDRRVTQRNPI